MTERITIGQLYPNGVAPLSPKRPSVNDPQTTVQGKTFGDILQDKLLKFSHHAELRLQQRGIRLNADQLAKMETAIDKAAAKGAKDSLILMQDMAFIVNVKNRTVVTAMDSGAMKDNVFTQIDSAIVVS